MTSHPPRPARRPQCREPEPGHAAAREHLRHLRRNGGTYRSIARAAGIGTMTVHDLAASRSRRPSRATVTAILAIPVGTLRHARADAGGTRLRLRALHVMGHGPARLARATGFSEKTIRALVRGDARTVSIRLRDIVINVYDAWWDKRAPERTPAEQAAARNARRQAIAGNWCAAAALDDDQLDTPGYKPAWGWKPARGTGTATDWPLPARPRPGAGRAHAAGSGRRATRYGPGRRGSGRPG